MHGNLVARTRKLYSYATDSVNGYRITLAHMNEQRDMQRRGSESEESNGNDKKG
jgi:hypothetical protein